jgi:hypothetical protein
MINLLTSLILIGACPTISVKTPKPGELLKGTYVFEANASDDKSGLEVSFWYNGKNYFNTEKTAPYMWSIDTHMFADGVRSVEFQAKDSGGCIQKAAVSFTVKNGSGIPSTTPTPQTSPSPSPTPLLSPSPQLSPTPQTSPSSSVFPISNPVAGYTTLKPSADSKIIYVSVTGSDSNDGLSPSKPIQTPSLAFTKLRMDKDSKGNVIKTYPDWIVFKSGDVWNRKLGSGSVQGRSSTEPVVISRYGFGPRPEFVIGNEYGFHSLGTVKNVIFEGLHIRGKAWSDASIKDSTGIRMQVGSGESITIENCLIEKMNDGIIISDGKGYKNVTVRRSIIADLKPSGTGWAGRKEGIYASAMNGLNLIENVFDQCGWDPNIPKTRTVFSHCAYIADSVYGLYAKGNIFSRGSEDGLKMRRGGVAEDNFFIQNGVGISVNDYQIVGLVTTVKDNVFTDGSNDLLSDYSSIAQARNFGIWNPKDKNGAALLNDSGNIFVNSVAGPGGSLAYSTISNAHFSLNKTYHWGKTSNSASAGTWPDPNRTIERYHKEVLFGSGLKGDFFQGMRMQSRENYNSKYSASQINVWFRAGF